MKPVVLFVMGSWKRLDIFSYTLRSHLLFGMLSNLNRWLGVVVVVPPGDVMLSYVQFVGSGRNRKIRKGFSSVWLVFVWVIWKARNDRIFNNVNREVEVAVECIQCIS